MNFRSCLIFDLMILCPIVCLTGIFIKMCFSKMEPVIQSISHDAYLMLKMWNACGKWALLTSGRQNSCWLCNKYWRSAIATPVLLVMRYKMSSYVSSVVPCFRLLLLMHIHHPLFILQSSKTLSLFSPCYLFLPLISPWTFSFLSSSFHLLPIPPTSPLPPSLSFVFWTFLLVFSVSLHPLHPPTHPPFPCDEWVCLLGAVHIYWVGERTMSVSLALHISIPPLKRQKEQ